jgi:exportin-T
VLLEMAVLVRNTVQARGMEAIEFLRGTMLPKLNCPPEYAEQLISSLRTQQAKDFRKTFGEFIKMLKG